VLSFCVEGGGVFDERPTTPLPGVGGVNNKSRKNTHAQRGFEPRLPLTENGGKPPPFVSGITAGDVDKPSKPPFDKGGFCFSLNKVAKASTSDPQRPFQGSGIGILIL